MSDPSQFSPEDLERQVKQHLESLKAAGVEWVPGAPRIVSPPFAPRDSGPPPGSVRPAAASTSASSPSGSVRPAGETAIPSPPPAGEGLFAEVDRKSPEKSRVALQVLAEKVRQCTRCPGLVVSRTQTVFGVGPLNPELCLVGEAPGADEDAQGEPFVGAAGQLLNRILAACKLKREEVYICNVLKCRPPGNRTPQPNEAANCKPYLEEQIDLIRPRFLCALGGAAAQTLLGTTQSLGMLRRRFHDFRGIPLMVTYHPAYLLPHRHPEKKKDVWEDMKMLMARMGRPVSSG